jgi:hypothetical protein
MRVDFFMLADGASVAEGKVYIHGGAITRVHAASYPSPPIAITAVARFLVDPADAESSHRVSIEWLQPNGVAWPPISTEIPIDQVMERFREGEEQGVLIVANSLISFEMPGSHEVRLRLDDQIVRERRLFATPLDDPSRPTITVHRTGRHAARDAKPGEDVTGSSDS